MLLYLCLMHTKKIILWFAVAFLSIQAVWAQQHSDYTPLQVSDAGAAELTSILQSVPSAAAKGAGSDKTNLYKAVNIEIKEKVKQGFVLYDDTLSRYLAAIGAQLASTRPSLQGTYKIYTLRSSSCNAFTFPNGAIFITTGLLAKLHSKSQVAFVLGHEFGHLIKKHGEQVFDKELNLKKDFKFSSSNNENSLEVLMHYSREFEMEADAIGVELVSSAGFNAREAEKAIKYISPEDTQFMYYKIDLRKSFQNEDFSIDSVMAKSSSGNYHSNSSRDGDDRLSTHPDDDKRFIAIKELLANMPGINIKPFEGDSLDYTKINYCARMENIRADFESGNYSGSIYLCLRSLREDAGNLYPKLMLTKNLIWLANYKNNDVFDEAFNESNQYYGRYFLEVESFLKKLSLNDIKKLSYSYIKHNFNTSDKNEELCFYLAYASDFYLGSGVSRFYFNQYLKEYPGGKYAGYAEKKLQ